ncbi:MAG: 2-C-methyl-D-erythritol 2,4-cyclodiphosphate synthase [Exilispira sp.]
MENCPIVSLMGFDIHKIVKNNKKEIAGLFIGGILVDKKHRFLAHSDGDILIHAIIDAISSYVSGKDIGQLFPDNDPMYKNYSSEKLLEKLIGLINNNYTITSIDASIIIEKFKIAPLKQQIINNLQKYFPQAIITIKGKRTEGGFKKNYGYCWILCNIKKNLS